MAGVVKIVLYYEVCWLFLGILYEVRKTLCGDNAHLCVCVLLSVIALSVGFL